MISAIDIVDNVLFLYFRAYQKKMFQKKEVSFGTFYIFKKGIIPFCD